MKKFIKSFVIVLFLLYFICLFLPYEFKLPNGEIVYGMEFLFLYVQTGVLNATWQVSLLIPAVSITLLFGLLFSGKTNFGYYLNIVFAGLSCVLYSIALLKFNANGMGFLLCFLVMAVISIFSVLGIMIQSTEKESRKSKGKLNRQCAFCERPLKYGETCYCSGKMDAINKKDTIKGVSKGNIEL